MSVLHITSENVRDYATTWFHSTIEQHVVIYKIECDVTTVIIEHNSASNPIHYVIKSSCYSRVTLKGSGNANVELHADAGEVILMGVSGNAVGFGNSIHVINASSEFGHAINLSVSPKVKTTRSGDGDGNAICFGNHQASRVGTGNGRVLYPNQSREDALHAFVVSDQDSSSSTSDNNSVGFFQNVVSKLRGFLHGL